MNKWLLLSALCLAGCAQSSSVTKSVPTPSPSVLPSPTPKPTPTPTPPPPTPEVARARSRSGGIEAVGKLWRTPSLHGGVEVRDTRTKRLLASWKVPSGVSTVSLSPNGNILAIGSPNKLTVWDWKNKKLLASNSPDASGAWVRISSAFSRNGRWLASTGNQGTVLFNTRSWKKRFFEMPFVDHVVFMPDNRFVVVSQTEGPAYSLIPTSGGKTRDIPPSDSHILLGALGDPLFSRDGLLMILGTGGERNEVQIWSVPRVRLLRKFALPGKEDDYFAPSALSPNARYLASQGQDRDQKGLIAVQRLSDGKTVFSAKQECDSLSWADNKTLQLHIGQTTKRLLKGGAR